MYDLEEQEKIDALKGYWNQYGRLIIIVVIAFVAGIAGVRFWQHHQLGQAEQASIAFTKLQEAQQKNDAAAVKSAGTEIMDKYGSTNYGAMAALLLAKANVDAGDNKTAVTQLQWAVDHARDDDTRALARFKLATLLLDEKKYEDAMRLLEQKHSEAMTALVFDLKGDVHFAQGHVAEARAAYKVALDKSAPSSNYRNVIQVKLDALGPAK
jgi:predicted negative regulator of RcsB-dependent stress response